MGDYSFSAGCKLYRSVPGQTAWWQRLDVVVVVGNAAVCCGWGICGFSVSIGRQRWYIVQLLLGLCAVVRTGPKTRF